MTPSFSLGRIGPFLSDRIVLNEDASRKSDTLVFGQFRKADTFWEWLLRVVSWIYSPACYTETNKKTIEAFQKYVTDLGCSASRLERIENRYGFKLKDLEKSGLLARHVAQILVGMRDVKIEDMNEKAGQSANELTRERFHEIHQELVKELRLPLRSFIPPLPIYVGNVTNGQTWTHYFHDRFTIDRKRLQIEEDFTTLDFETYVQMCTMHVIKQELDVGMLIPAPQNEYYVVEAKLVTGEGMVSYIFAPVAKDSQLPKMQLFRGTGYHTHELDMWSTGITDFERELGRMADDSGKGYEKHLKGVTVLAGHSLGAVLAQYRLSRDPTIQKAYLFNGPGVPVSVKDAFNQLKKKERKEHFKAIVKKVGRIARNDPQFKIRLQGEILQQLKEDFVEQFRAQERPRLVILETARGKFSMTRLKRKEPLHLVIREAARDEFSAVGQVHLGFKAPSNVYVDYKRWHAPLSVPSSWTHVVVPAKDRYAGLEGSPPDVDAILDRSQRPDSHEGLRALIGPPLAWIAKRMRDVFRYCFGSRVDQEKGLQQGFFQNRIWTHAPRIRL